MCESEFSESEKDLKLEGIKYPKHLLKKFTWRETYLLLQKFPETHTS